MAKTDGLLVVDKPGGWTSHDVVARCRRLCGTRKVGHAGTLDPMATGVLLIGVGRATRLLGRLALADKSYDATIRLGQATETDDAEGDPTSQADASGLARSSIDAAVSRLTGPIDQRPSAVSAIKIAGERAYKRVRAGEDVVLPARSVMVSRFDVLAVHTPADDPRLLDVDVRVDCSTGTYVRALARDLGASLGVGGHLTQLRRTRVGPYPLAAATPLDDLAEHPDLLSLESVAGSSFDRFDLSPEQEEWVRHGSSFKADLGSAGQVALFGVGGDFLALYEQHGPLAKAVAVFTG